MTLCVTQWPRLPLASAATPILSLLQIKPSWQKGARRYGGLSDSFQNGGRLAKGEVNVLVSTPLTEKGTSQAREAGLCHLSSVLAPTMSHSSVIHSSVLML